MERMEQSELETKNAGKNNKKYDMQVEALLQELTLEEKISMIHGKGFFRTAAVPRLGIPELVMSDGPMGVRMEFPDDSWIPVGHSDDYVSYAPGNSALAATWNPERSYAGGKILGAEARGRGKDVILGPGINIKRDPLCGRNFEYMSEDPYLVETLTVPFIQGVQENDVAACVKHFAANGQETDRFQVDTIVDERTLREIYYPGFEAAVKKAGTLSLMNAYNKLNGIHCSEHQGLLNELLREEWGYDGTVISDWGSVHTTKEAAEAAIDVEMSVTTDFDDYHFARPLLEAVQKGEVEEEAIDQKVRNILRMMFRLKMMGEDAVNRKPGANNTTEHQQGIRKTAEEAIVLLKNEENVLPIRSERLRMTWETTVEKESCTAKGWKQAAEKEANAVGAERLASPRKRRIAVIGHNGEHNHAGGGGSAEIKALYEISPLLGLKQALGGNVEIVYAQGYYIPGTKSVNEVNWQEASLERQVMGREDPDNSEQQALRKEIAEKRAEFLKEACELARTADEVIFVGGLNHDYDVEGRDRGDMKLPYGQDELVEALLDICPNAIVVMVAGSPVEMPWVDRVKALLWCYYSGMETGTVLADILLGKVNPSAKLPETFPKQYADTVTAKNGQFGLEGRIVCEEGIFVGYRYYEKERIEPAFPFGYGLSYTEFVIKDMVCKCGSGEEPVQNDIAGIKVVGITCVGEEVREAEDVLANAGTGGRKGDVEVAEVQSSEKRICIDRMDVTPVVTLEVTVTNTGKMPGAEVVQCYVSDCECSVERPVKELKAYRKVFLQPGESKTVTLELPAKSFAFYDVEQKSFVVEPGRFLLHVGNASDNCKLWAEVELV